MSDVVALLESSPVVEHHRFDAMTTSDVDAHFDGPRIWATIVAIKEYYDHDPEVEGNLTKAKNDLKDKTSALVKKLRDALTTLQAAPTKKNGDAVVLALTALEDFLES